MSEILPPVDPILWVLGSEHIDSGWIECTPATWLLQVCEYLAGALPMVVLITLIALAMQAFTRCAHPVTSSQSPRGELGHPSIARGKP